MKFNVGDRVVSNDGAHDGIPGIVTRRDTIENHEWYSVLHTNGSIESYFTDEIRAYDPDIDGDFDISYMVNDILSCGYIRQAEPVKQLKICAEFNGICIHDHEAKEKRITVNIAEVVAVSESVIEELGKTCIDVGNGTRFYVKETYDEVRNAIGWEV
jgi:hypothetical protein